MNSFNAQWASTVKVTKLLTIGQVCAHHSTDPRVSRELTLLTTTQKITTSARIQGRAQGLVPVPPPTALAAVCVSSQARHKTVASITDVHDYGSYHVTA